MAHLPELRRLLPILLLALGMAGAAPYDPASEVIVTVSSSRVDPEVVEIRRGVRLTFHCLSDLPGGLVVVAADGSFESWSLGMNSQWSHHFAEIGTFEFFVKGHPETRGRVIVR